MGESTHTVNFACFSWVKHNRSATWHILLTALIIGAVIGISFRVFVMLTEPINPRLAPGDPIRVASVQGGGFLLSLHYVSARTAWCNRQTSELLFTRNAEWDGRKMRGYYALAYNMNGPGMYYGTADEYVLYRYLPAGIQPGTWQYILRVRHECAPFGLVHHTYSSEAVDIVIPDGS